MIFHFLFEILGVFDKIVKRSNLLAENNMIIYFKTKLRLLCKG